MLLKPNCHYDTNPKNKEGKIEFIDALLIAGGKTKPEIQKLAEAKFPGIGANTTNWASSTLLKRTGQKSNHLKKNETAIQTPKIVIPKRK